MGYETVRTIQHDSVGGASRSGQRRRAVGIAGVVVALGSFVAPTSVAVAAAGDYQLDFTAAAPYTYNHLTGGGAYDGRAVGVDKDIVESLEGGDFRCGDHVTYLTRISRDDLPTQKPNETIELKYTFLADTTGLSGVAMTDVLFVGINYAPQGTTSGVGPLDLGNKDDGNSVATLISEGIVGGKPAGTAFTKGAKLEAVIQVSDLERDESVILRIDVLLDCKVPFNPTGNLQASLTSAKVLGAVPARTGTISVGNQTIPFKQVEDVYPLVTTSFANVVESVNSSATRGGVEVASLAPPAQMRTASVARSASSLPVTGSSSTLGLVQLGALLATAGLVGLVASRRRSLAAHSRHR